MMRFWRVPSSATTRPAFNNQAKCPGCHVFKPQVALPATTVPMSGYLKWTPSRHPAGPLDWSPALTGGGYLSIDSIPTCKMSLSVTPRMEIVPM
ncbi:hypothetical protein VTN96DRAFT_788 [Rasamsonia emersonii]